jgi:hypothetical protein
MPAQDKAKNPDRGRRASFNRKTGEVAGSGADAGNNPDGIEEYDDDLHEEAPIAQHRRDPAKGA